MWNGMKIYFQVQPVSRRCRGWQRLKRVLRYYLDATLVVETASRRRH